MPLFLSSRRPGLVEEMDRPDCDAVKLENTYRQFHLINTLLSAWRKVYRRWLRPVLREASSSRPPHLLDIGFGGGDIALALARWAREDGIDLRVTAIETDPRALEFSSRLESDPRVDFRHCASSQLVAEGARFDIVITNHVLHHLEGAAFDQVLTDADALASRLALFNDIERSDLGYLLFTTFTRPVFFNSYIIRDGLTSIRRSYTRRELEGRAPAGWQVRPCFPFRLLLIKDKGKNKDGNQDAQ